MRDGQHPNALIIACADSRVSPEHITQAGPGELFVCRNAGNIVPPFAQQNGGVSSAIEYAVVAYGVSCRRSNRIVRKWQSLSLRE